MNEGQIIDTNLWGVVIATYAAIVATGALFLEVRRWFETGPRLNIGFIANAETFGMPGTEGNTYIAVNVSNRGTEATTITNFALHEFGTWLDRLRFKPKWSAIVPNPQPPGSEPNLPSILQPGEMWHGMAKHDDELLARIKTGRLYLAIYASHTSRPILQRVTLSAEPPGDAQRM